MKGRRLRSRRRATLNELGYRIDRRDRATGRVVGRGTTRRGWMRGQPAYDEITVSVAHEPLGDWLHVTSTDRGHAERVAAPCGRAAQ
jgi:hypothetical protein